MSAQYRGSFSVGECLPIAVQAKGGIDVAVAATLPELTAKLAGAIQAQAAITLNPPTLATQLEAALQLVEQLKAAIAIGLPGAMIDLTVVAAVVAEIQATLGSIQAQASLSVSLGITLGAAGVHLITQGGTLGSLGSDVSGAAAAIGTGDTTCHAVCLVTTTPAAWTALQAAVKTS